FDQVFILLADPPARPEDKRALYVAMTRARRQLVIHTYGNGLRPFATPHTRIMEDHKAYDSPGELFVQLTHKDVFLEYFQHRQPQIARLKTGQQLKVSEEGCTD